MCILRACVRVEQSAANANDDADDDAGAGADRRGNQR